MTDFPNIAATGPLTAQIWVAVWVAGTGQK